MTQQEHNQREWENPANWRGPKWLSMYCSPRDTRVWVPKQIPAMGWTVNLGHRAGIAWLIAIAALVIGFVGAVILFAPKGG